MFLGALLLLLVWAELFTGSWQRISFQDEVPNTLILAAVLTSFTVVLRNIASGRARTLLIFGLAIIAFEVFFELPLKKYVAVHPASAPEIRQWFFLFGLTEFIGMVIVLYGMGTLIYAFNKTYE
jgi:hypothetical protein